MPWHPGAKAKILPKKSSTNYTIWSNLKALPIWRGPKLQTLCLRRPSNQMIRSKIQIKSRLDCLLSSARAKSLKLNQSLLNLRGSGCSRGKLMNLSNPLRLVRCPMEPKSKNKQTWIRERVTLPSDWKPQSTQNRSLETPQRPNSTIPRQDSGTSQRGHLLSPDSSLSHSKPWSRTSQWKVAWSNQGKNSHLTKQSEINQEAWLQCARVPLLTAFWKKQP